MLCINCGKPDGTCDCHIPPATLVGKGIVNTKADPDMAMVEVFECIDIERQHQDRKHGPVNTHGHTLGEWILIMEAELNEAKEALIKGGRGRNEVRHEILQVVATGVACLEQHGVDHAGT